MKKEVLTPSHKYWRALCTRLSHTQCQHDLRNTEKILKSLPNIDVEESLNLYLELGGFCDCEILFNVEEGWKKN